MSITPDQIDLWLQVPRENRRLEFKKAANSYDFEKTLKYCNALANEEGGHFILGVTDALPRSIVGTQAFPTPGKTEQQLFRKLGFRVDIEEVAHPLGRVLVFHIPCRPIGTAYPLDGAFYMRVGEELHPMSEERLRTIHAEGQPHWSEGTAERDLSAQEIIQRLDTQTFFELLQEPYPTHQEAVLERLISERLIVEQNGTFTVKNVCALLLAKNLRQFDTVYRKVPRVIVYRGDGKLETISDTATSADRPQPGYAVGFEALVAYVMSQIPQNEIVEQALRQKSKLLPEVIIRELVANALIHQDLEIGGTSPCIEIYANRIEISNPGEPIVPIEQFINSYQSRNERLADIMRRCGICEEKGSGIDRVIETAEIHQLPAPLLTTSFGRTCVVIHGPRAFSEMDQSDRIRACYQHCCLQRILHRQMTNQSLRERFGLAKGSSNVASQIISQTLEQRLIKVDPTAPNSKKYARYLPFWA